MDEPPQYSNRDYTVGWLCALPPSELTAARRMLDRSHKDPGNRNLEDKNFYYFGEIGGHNVVLACLAPEKTGNLAAQKLVQPLKRSFPNMILHLFVGIGGGIPRNPSTRNPNEDIHLGDVVVGWPDRAGIPAIVQYDHCRYNLGGDIDLLSIIDKPNPQLLNALTPIISDREMGQMSYHHHLDKLRDLPGFQHPGLGNDTLFEADYGHVKADNPVETDYPYCHRCDLLHAVKRPPRETMEPQFHQGTILSGSTVMKDGRMRDDLGKRHHNAICFEMEAAGVADDTHCLVIRGIADYADSHKYRSWQNYAAATAAAFARELLLNVRPVVLATGSAGGNDLATEHPMLNSDTTEFYNILNQGEQHFRESRHERIAENLITALSYFLKADTILRKLGIDDPSLDLKVYFRLMTVEADLSHNRHWKIEERIKHIRGADKYGAKARTLALDCKQRIAVVQVQLEQAFVKGRKAELEAQRGGGVVDLGEIQRVKEEARHGMKLAMQELRELDGCKYSSYLDRASRWEKRLSLSRRPRSCHDGRRRVSIRPSESEDRFRSPL